MRAAYRRLAATPREPINPSRQFPLRGKALKGIWQYELTSGDRLYYTVQPMRTVVVLVVMPHAADAQAAAVRVVRRMQAGAR